MDVPRRSPLFEPLEDIAYNPLEIGLLRVDHRHRDVRAPEARARLVSGERGRIQPPTSTRLFFSVYLVAERVADQADLPRRVRDVLGYVDHCPVGPHDDLLLAGLRVRDDPAPPVLALGLELHQPLLLHLLEDPLPHPRMDQLRLPVEEVVSRSEPPAGLKLRGEYPPDDPSCILGDLAGSLLDFLQDERLLLLEPGILRVLLVDLRVDAVSAVDVELDPGRRHV